MVCDALRATAFLEGKTRNGILSTLRIQLLLDGPTIDQAFIHGQFFMHLAFPSGRSAYPRITDMRTAPHAVRHSSHDLRSRVAD